MAQVATITIGSNSYSVYGITSDALDDANDYLAARLGAGAWTDASSSDKKRALVSAVRFLDRAVIWSGTQTDTATPQPLQWPRDGASCGGTSVASGTIPDNFAYAQFEIALALLNDSSVQDGTGTGSNVKRVKAGSAEVEFFTPTIGAEFETRLPTVANDLVGCYIASDLGLGSLSYGTTDADGESSFDNCDQHNRTQGYP